MGIAGRIARTFLRSKLTPLITIAALAVGAIGIVATPREEEPQISVPMIDVLTGMPGAGPEEVENTVTRAVERRMWELPGVEHVYSSSGEGWSLVTVRFRVGEDQDRSVTRVQAKLTADGSALPPGVTTPLVKPHSIDDVPVFTLTLSSDRYDANALRAMAVHLEDEVRTVSDVSTTLVTGGQPQRIRVELDPARLGGRGVSASEVLGALDGAGARVQAGEFPESGRVVRVDAGAPLESAEDVALVVVAIRGGSPVLLRDVASVREEFGEPRDYVMHAESEGGPRQAVTLSVAKRPGANASTVTHEVERRIEDARARLFPAEVNLSVTRDYGETAAEKARELIRHLLLATVSVTLLVGIFLGWREAMVVLVAVPVTLALTLFVYYALGYTLNRITLFALIFSIGILVDDAIVVVENIYRHLKRRARDPETAAVEAVDEVGNPTILATLTVIAGHPADGGGVRVDGSLHAAHSGWRVGCHAGVTRCRIRRHPVPRPQAVARPLWPGRTGRRSGA